MLKQIWDMAKYISFVFHHKSAQVVAKTNDSEKEEEIEDKCTDSQETDDDYKSNDSEKSQDNE